MAWLQSWFFGLDNARVWVLGLVWAVSMASAQGQTPLGLAEAVRLSMEQDATLRASRWQVESVGERVAQAKAQLWPNVSLSVGRFQNDLDRTQPNLLGVDTTTNDQYYSYNQTLQIRQPLYRPATARGIDVAEAQWADAKALMAREEQTTAMKVVEAYVLVLQAQHAEALLQTQRSMADRQLDAARKRFEAGQGVRTDMDEVQARIDLLNAQLLEAGQTRQTALLQLRLLTQASVSAVRVLHVESLKLDGFEAPDLRVWIDKALENSPEIKTLQARVEAARLEVLRARTGHQPTLDAVAQISRSGSENVTSPRSSYVNRQVGLQLNVPLYAGGAIQSSVRQALAEQSRAEELLEALRRDLEVRVQREWRGMVEGARRALALETALQSADRMVTSVTRSYEAGVRTVLDVLNAEDRKQQAMRDVMDASLSHVAARLRLQALAGELGEEQLRQADGWFADAH